MNKNLLYKDSKQILLSSKLNVLDIRLEKILNQNRDINEYKKLTKASDLISDCIRSIARRECKEN